MAHVSFWHTDCTRAGIQMACGIHMTVVSTDLMYKLWYVFTICGLSLLESNFLDSSFANFTKTVSDEKDLMASVRRINMWWQE